MGRSMEYRRYQMSRLKDKRKDYSWRLDDGKVFVCFGEKGVEMRPLTKQEKLRIRGLRYTTPQRCSCIGCGNQRQWEGGKLDEKSHAMLAASEGWKI